MKVHHLLLNKGYSFLGNKLETNPIVTPRTIEAHDGMNLDAGVAAVRHEIAPKH